MQVRQGEIIAGKYIIERVLGEGGMGIVVQATHVHLDERVAIKFLLPHALGNEEAVARFAREARAAVKIKSEHVARVSDVGTLETGAPYMVMEFLQGQDLSELVGAQGPLPIEDAADYVLQASEAIAEAHALGIIHRDLKPANLFLIRRADGSPCVKVLDFGISKMTVPGSSGSDLGMTRTHAIMGSPLYMAPEQMASTRDVDARADVWALGAILYELLTGRVPFQADTMPQLCAMILQESVTPPRSVRLDMPEGLQAVLLRCLEKDRTQRFQNVAEMAVALVPFAHRSSLRSAERISRVLSAAGLPSSAVGVGAGPTSRPQAAVATSSVTQSGFGKTLSKSGGRALWVVVAAALVGTGAAAALWLRPHAGPASAGEALAPTLSSVQPTADTSHLAESEAPPAVAPVTAPVPSAQAAPSASSAATPTTAAVARAPATPRRPATGAPRPATTPSAAPTPAVPAKAIETAGPSLDPLRGRH